MSDVNDNIDESAQPTDSTQKRAFEPIFEDRPFLEVLKSHLGKVFLIANPESFEESGLGHQIHAGWYKAKLVGVGQNYLIVVTEFTHGTGKHASKEPCKQYIPLDKIKRLSLMRTERLLHL